MVAETPQGLTVILGRARGGDERARGELIALIYDELRRVASSLMRRERADHTLSPTAVVHEAVIRLLGEAVFDGEAGRGGRAGLTGRGGGGAGWRGGAGDGSASCSRRRSGAIPPGGRRGSAPPAAGTTSCGPRSPASWPTTSGRTGSGF